MSCSTHEQPLLKNMVIVVNQPFDVEEWRTHNDPIWQVLQDARPSFLDAYFMTSLDNLFATEDEATPVSIDILLNSLFPKGTRTDEEYTDYKGGVLFTYIENRLDQITRANLRNMCMYEPRLKSYETADFLLNSGNIEAVRGMEDAGYTPDENLAKTMFLINLDWYKSEYTPEEDNEHVTDLTPAIEYLMSHNLGHIIDLSAFEYARAHQDED